MAKQKFWNGASWEVVGTDAAKVTVVDAANKLTATNVEDALLELFTFANNGKTDIASVIGSPATSGDTFTQLKTHIQTSKNDLATNLTAKGQSSVGTETLDALIDKIPLISTGKKKATGTITSTGVTTTASFQDHTGASNAYSYVAFNMANLPFTPAYIEFLATDKLTVASNTQWRKNNHYVSGANFANVTRGTTAHRVPYVNGVVNIPMLTGNKSYDWTAYEE